MQKISIILYCFLHFSLQAQNLSYTFGGNDTDKGYAMDKNLNGDFYVVGSVESSNGDAAQKHVDDDIWVLKFDNQYHITWQEKLGGFGIDEGLGVAATNDGGCVVVGITNSTDSLIIDNHGDRDAVIAKYAADGTREWLKLLGGTSYEVLYAVKQTSEGGYIAIGQASSQDGDVQGNHGQWDMWVVKLSAIGEIEWQKCLGGSNLESGFDIELCGDGNYIAVGYTRSINGDVTVCKGEWDMWLVKLSDSGQIIWQKTFGGTGSDGGYAIKEIENVGYIAAGWTVSPNDGDVQGNHGSSDAWLVRTDLNGNLIGQNTFGGTASEQARNIALTTNGWISVGYTRSVNGDLDGNAGLDDAFLAKWDMNGNLLGAERIAGSKYDILLDVVPINDNKFVALGWTDSQDGDMDSTKGVEDVWLLEINDLTLSNESSFEVYDFSFFPNPAQDWLSISVEKNTAIEIFDIFGQKHLQFTANPQQKIYPITELPEGVFLLKPENIQISKKFLHIR